MFCGVGIPEADFSPTPTGEYLSIGTECYVIDRSYMSCERFLVFAGVCIPEADSAVFASTGKCASIRAECHAVDIIRMSL